MSYSELPPVIKTKDVAQGITIEGMKDIGGCCLNHLAVVQPRAVGQRMVCSKCDNRLNVVETVIPLFEKSGPVGEVKLRSDSAVHLVQFLKPYWTMYTVDNYLRKEKLNKTYVVDTGTHITVVPHASEWFEKGSIQITVPEPGVCRLIGRVKESCQARVKEIAKGAMGVTKNDIEVY